VQAKATIQLDGQELTLLIQASIARSKSEMMRENHHKSGQYLILADKLAEAKEDFHQRQYAYLSDKYGINEEKSAGEQTLQGK
jgi:hypothetical protein